MPEVKTTSSDTEFTQIESLNQLSDKELETIVIKGDNLHIHTSRASVAKRLLENRRQIAQQSAQLSAQASAEMREVLLKENLFMLYQIVDALDYIKARWLPNKPLWVKLLAFFFVTVLLGIALNLAATWIALYWLHWR